MKNNNLNWPQTQNKWQRFWDSIRWKTSDFEIVKSITYLVGASAKDTKDKLPTLKGETSHIYMWKMNLEEEWIYNDDFIKWILEYYFYCTPKWGHVILELANTVSDVLWENMEWFLNFEEQKQYITELVKDNFKKEQVQRLEIIDIETRHPALFAGLREYKKVIEDEAKLKWLSKSEYEKTPSFDKLDFLETWKEAPLLPPLDQPFSSLDIAKYLYHLCKNNKVFFSKIRGIKPEKAKSKYYAIIEIAIRMTDLLNGVSVQWWAMKQKHYDDVIREILNPYQPISQYPEIYQLRDFCNQRLWDNKLETIYIDTIKYKAYAKKINAEKQVNNKTRRITWMVSGLIFLTFLSGLGVHFYNIEKLKKETKETIKEIFENRKIQSWSEMGTYEYVWESKLEWINEKTQDIYDRFVFRYDYDPFWEVDKLEFKAKIIDCLNNQDVLDLLASDGSSERLCHEDVVIDDYLIPQNYWEFKINKIPTKPYQKLVKEHLPDFINTILLDKDLETDRETKFTKPVFRGVNQYPSVIDIWEYAPKDLWYYGFSGWKYRLWLAWNGLPGHNYIVATHGYYGDFKKDESPKLMTSIARDLAFDLIKQTQPIINELLDQYLLRYHMWDDMHSMNHDWPNKVRLSSSIQELLIKDFLRKWLLNKIQKIQTNKIINYLDEFAIENHDTLSKLWWETNKDVLPNWYLQEYEEAMKNTIKDDKKLFGGNARMLVTNRWEKAETATHIWRYRASDGKIYLLWITTINGKKYLYADDDADMIYGWERTYGCYEGKIVAEDYFKMKSQFLQKKLLLEKKLKSSSQTYKWPQNKPYTFSDYVKDNPKGIVPR